MYKGRRSNLSQIIKPVMLDETGQATNQKLETLKNTVDSGDLAKVAKLLQIAEAIESVHSVNGMTGDVVIDGSNIQLNKLDPNSKTIPQVLAEEQSRVNDAMSQVQAAVARTPLRFTTEPMGDDTYLMVVDVGMP